MNLIDIALASCAVVLGVSLGISVCRACARIADTMFGAQNRGMPPMPIRIGHGHLRQKKSIPNPPPIPACDDSGRIQPSEPWPRKCEFPPSGITIPMPKVEPPAPDPFLRVHENRNLYGGLPTMPPNETHREGGTLMSWNRKTSRKDRKDRKRKEPRFIGGFFDGTPSVQVTRETFDRRWRQRRRNHKCMTMAVADLDREFIRLRASEVFPLYMIYRPNLASMEYEITKV